MTAEPRMEELLASIRKAIHDDIGEVPSSMSSRSAGTLQRGATREYHVKAGEDAGAAAAEIQQLREKISRSRAADTAPMRQAPGRVDSITAALHAEAPRRSWRDIEVQPRLRPSIVEAEPLPPPPPAQRVADHQPRHEPIVEPHYHQPAWREEPSALPPPPPAQRVADHQPRHDPIVEPHYHQPVWREEPPALPPPPREAYRPRAESPPILSGDTSQAVNAAFARLAETMMARATGDRSLEDLTREILRGMLKQWLDDNLPALVERLVREEIERVARNGR